jgi:hypothetical protein
MVIGGWEATFQERAYRCGRLELAREEKPPQVVPGPVPVLARYAARALRQVGNRRPSRWPPIPAGAQSVHSAGSPGDQ